MMPDSELPDFSLRGKFPNKEERSEFFRAVERNDIAAVRKVLDSNPDCLNWRDKSALASNRPPLMAAVASAKPEMIKLLLDRGADVNGTNDDGWTPLINAAFFGNAEVVELLIRRGANVNQATGYGDTPLGYAAKRDHWECADLLVICGADPDQKNKSGQTPIDLAKAAGNDEIIQIMKDARARLAASKAAKAQKAATESTKPETGENITVGRPLELRKDPPMAAPPVEPQKKKPWRL